MMYQNILEMIGNTPLIELEKGIFAKAEYFNPSGSIKDRIAKYIIEKAEQSGQLNKGMRIVEATSGNTGISFAMLSSLKGYKFTAYMPESASVEREKLMSYFGAEVIRIEVDSIYDLLKHTEKHKESFLPRQFSNFWNVEAHYQTANEIIDQLAQPVDAFIAGVGTGGSLMGIATVLKKEYGTKIFAAEPSESQMLAKNETGHHKIQGVNDGFIPKILDKKLIDGVISVPQDKAIAKAKEIGKRGYLAGLSSGLNVSGAEILKEKGFKTIVTLLPDSATRYYSTELFE